jgi:precorrin-8X/cobalt-precorrin-8 methylmutase
VIHATADFDYADNLFFTSHAVQDAVASLRGGADIVTDTNMAKAGISVKGLSKLGGSVICHMAEPEIAAAAKRDGITRAAAAVRLRARIHDGAVYAVGNAPTALIELERQIRDGFRPALVIGVPVGFVNVVESKEQILACCTKLGIPAIVALGRKGGSTVAAAVCNALIYEAAGMQDPGSR